MAVHRLSCRALSARAILRLRMDETKCCVAFEVLCPRDPQDPNEETPERVIQCCVPGNPEMLIACRIAARDSVGRARGVLCAMLWDIISVTVAILPGGGALLSVADLVTTFSWILLFSLVGLLLLPAINRKRIVALDQQIAGYVNRTELQEAISEIDKLSEQDPTRSASAASIFRPIPCPERRRLSLEREGPQCVLAWNVARTTLYLSRAFGGPLARAVHCNVGRPELWANVPAD